MAALESVDAFWGSPESWRASLCGFPAGGRGVLVVEGLIMQAALCPRSWL